jgi:DNA invertase Pin-like site-specific DNA recombinase
MDRVRDLVTAGGVCAVLAQDRDRIACEPAYLYLLREEFGQRGCVVKALNDRGDDSPEGQLTDGIMDQIARFECLKTAERTRRGKLQRAREGKVVPSRRVNYGFVLNAERTNYLVDEERGYVARDLLREGLPGVRLLYPRRQAPRIQEAAPGRPRPPRWGSRDHGPAQGRGTFVKDTATSRNTGRSGLSA